jgi:hypothetical protein
MMWRLRTEKKRMATGLLSVGDRISLRSPGRTLGRERRLSPREVERLLSPLATDVVLLRPSVFPVEVSLARVANRHGFLVPLDENQAAALPQAPFRGPRGLRKCLAARGISEVVLFGDKGFTAVQIEPRARVSRLARARISHQAAAREVPQAV